MHKYVKNIVALVLVLSFNATFYMASGHAQIKAPKIAVVDLAKLSKGLKETKHLKANERKTRLEIEAEWNKKIDELKKLKQLLDNTSDPTARVDIQKKLEEMVRQATDWKQAKERKITKKQSELTAKMYSKILAAIKQIAEAQEIDLVIHKDWQPDLLGLEGAQLNSAIANKRIFYVKEKLDITTDVEKKLNDNFKK